MQTGGTILVVEDDEDDFFFAERVLRKVTKSRIIHVPSGKAAIEYLSGAAPYENREQYPFPAMMFLDLKMDRGSGLEVLAWIRANPMTQPLEIFVLSGSNEPKDREAVKQSGVTAGYIVKPLAAEHAREIFAERG